MTAENTPAPDGPDPVDWDRLEAEIRGQDGAADAEDQDGTARVLVDSAEAQRPGRTTLAALRAAERRPIVPAWLRSAREARGVAAWALGFAAHVPLGLALLRAPPLLRWAAFACMVATLGVAGRRADRPLIQRAVAVPKAPRLTSDMVVAALGAIGNAAVNQALAKTPDAIEF